MPQLSQAKKDKDVVTLFMWAQQHLSDHEMWWMKVCLNA
jgi:hypothetical protein